MRLLLIRHGQTTSNVSGLLDSDAPGPLLTDLGHRQAEAVPGALAGRSIDAVVVSTLRRTTQTATPLLRERGLAPRVLDGVREVESGALEMASDEASHQAYLGAIFAWPRGDLDREVPGGPSGHDFLARFDAALAEVAGWGLDDVVVFSHGAAIRAWSAARVAGVDVDVMESVPLANTGAVDVETDPSAPHGWRLVDATAHPLGGEHLTDVAADDPTGEPVH